MVLSQKAMEEIMDVDYTDQSKSWLLTDLPRIPVFPQVKEQICVAIRQVFFFLTKTCDEKYVGNDQLNKNNY